MLDAGLKVLIFIAIAGIVLGAVMIFLVPLFGFFD